MEAVIDIKFGQLIKIVKTLPKSQLKRLMDEINKKGKERKKTDLESLLLNGPIATKEQLEIIKNNRKSINEWRNYNID